MQINANTIPSKFTIIITSTIRDFMLLQTKLAIAVGLTFLLAACGGGGGKAGTADTPLPPAATAASFPIQTALVYAFSNNLPKTLNVTGTAASGGNSLPISGSLTYSSGATTSTTFNNAPALQVKQTVAGSLSIGGQQVPLSASNYVLLNASYAELGSVNDGSYCVVTSGGTFPVTLSAGQSVNISTFSCYTDSSKAIPNGSVTETYSARAGSVANTLDFQLTDLVYDTSGKQVSTQGTTYNITTAGVPSVSQFA